VVAYLEGREDLDSHRMGLWGDSFAPANPAHFLIDEQVQWQVGPEFEQQAEPLGGLLATLGAIFEDHVRTIAVRGGLASYLSVLDDNFAYVPADVIVPGILQAGDIADVVAALVPRPILLEGLVDGRDRLLQETDLQNHMAPLNQAYQGVSTSNVAIHSGQGGANLAEWFRARL
jgi:hypothetical protein